VGQQVRVASRNNQPVDFAVEQVEVAAHPSGGLRLVLVTRVTNPGTLPTATSLRLGAELRLVDERGRRFPEARSEQGLLPDLLAREYGARQAEATLAPGVSARQVWAFVVAPDVQRLTLTYAPNR
jgi:hypothetical protein